MGKIGGVLGSSVIATNYGGFNCIEIEWFCAI